LSGYVDLARLAADAGFRAQVKIAIMNAAITVQGEPIGSLTDAQLDKRQQLATSILASPDAHVDRFAWALATQAGALGAPVSIASSTNANPTVVTTSVAHGLAVGDVVEIAGHPVNTAANGTWTVTVVGSATTFTIAVAGNGAGTAGGTVTKLPPDSAVQAKVTQLYNQMAGIRTND
jgi:hypothetical protein